MKSIYNFREVQEALNISCWGSAARLVQFFMSLSLLITLYEESSWMFAEESEDAAFGCVRAAPLLRGLALKSGQEPVFPPLLSSSSSVFFFLPLFFAPSFFTLSALTHIPTLSPEIDLFCFFFSFPCSRVQSPSIFSHPSLLWLHFIPRYHSPSICLFPAFPSLILSHAHICDQIMRRIMGLLSLMAGIKVGEQRGGCRGLMSISW